jgi:hypothetical protein
MPSTTKGLSSASASPLGDQARAVLTGGRQQDGELVAAEPGDRVVRAQRGSQPRPHLGQQLVTHGMTETVVDVLEPIKVDHHHRQRRGRAGCGDGLGGQIHQGGPVRQPGQLVVGGLMQQIGLHLYLFGDVAAGHHHQTVLLARRDRPLQHVPGTGRGAHPRSRAGSGTGRRAGAQVAVQKLAERRAIIDMHQGGELLPTQVSGRPAEQAHGRAGHLSDVTVPQCHHHVAGSIDHRSTGMTAGGLPLRRAQRALDQLELLGRTGGDGGDGGTARAGASRSVER